MWPYLTMASLLAVGASVSNGRRISMVFWSALFVLLVLFVGLRHHVGMDWNNYLRMIDVVKSTSDFGKVITVAEPGYALLLAFGAWTGFDMYAVNFIATSVAMIGVFAWARLTPNPWLAMMSAFPVFIMVVLMGANRQALAIGLIMLTLSYWYRLSMPLKVVAIMGCAMFHASALIFLVFVALDLRVSVMVKGVGIAFMTAVLVYILQSTGQAEYYDQAYGSGLREATESSGAYLHVSLTAIPAAIGWFAFPKHRQIFFRAPIVKYMAFAAMATLLLVPISSAAAGRISLYWFPMAMWFWAALPEVVVAKNRVMVRVAISALMILIAYVWLTTANSAFAHLPYGNALFMPTRDLEIGVVP